MLKLNQLRFELNYLVQLKPTHPSTTLSESVLHFQTTNICRRLKEEKRKEKEKKKKTCQYQSIETIKKKSTKSSFSHASYKEP